MMLDKKLYFITDSNGVSDEEILNIVKKALEAGASMIQLREKMKSDRDVIELARRIKQVTDQYKVPLIVDDRLDVSMIVGCHLHLGQDDIQICEARKLLGHDKIIGATAKTVEQARQAELDGASYLGVGAIYETTTKLKANKISTDTLRSIIDNVSIPVYAIGGLNKSNLGILKDSGVSGVCVSSSIMRAKDPFEETKLLVQELEKLN